MADKPILFSGPMVQAILEGRKVQTRRVMKPQPILENGAWYWKSPKYDNGAGADYFHTVCVDGIMGAWLKAMPYQIGDRLWVRETWRPLNGYSNWDLRIKYAADDTERHIADGDYYSCWRWPKAADKGNVPSIFMPRWASRMTCIIDDVRIQRLQDISEADAAAEGVKRLRSKRGYYDPVFDDGMVSFGHYCTNAREAFQRLWDSINAKRDGGKWSWEANPWVVAITFTTIHENINKLSKPE